jgi:nicotinate phosphoribosyltransferase
MFIPKKCIVDRREVRKALFPTEHGPIIEERSYLDWYKRTMGQYFFMNHSDVKVEYKLFNRTKAIKLAEEINPDDLQRELNHVAGLRYTETEISYLASRRNGNNPLFSAEYLQAVRDSVLPSYQLDIRDGQFDFGAGGTWHDAEDWEIYKLVILSALRTESLMKKKNHAEQDAVVEYTASKLEENITVLQEHPKVKFSSFATRRAASPMWLYIVERTAAEHLGKDQFIGTSNASHARKLGINPVGTDAHERAMVEAALTNSDAELRESPINTLRRWFKLYGKELSIALPDTFGSDWMFKNLPEEFAIDWNGMRQDSMNLNRFGEKQIQFYKKFGVDSREHVMVPSDGLTLDSMTYDFMDRMDIRPGYGSNFGNDTGLGHPSIVVKAVNAWRNPHDKRSCVKLSDNIQKAIGDLDEIKRYARVFEYKASDDEVCLC